MGTGSEQGIVFKNRSVCCCHCRECTGSLLAGLSLRPESTPARGVSEGRGSTSMSPNFLPVMLTSQLPYCLEEGKSVPHGQKSCTPKSQQALPMTATPPQHHHRHFASAHRALWTPLRILRMIIIMNTVTGVIYQTTVGPASHCR